MKMMGISHDEKSGTSSNPENHIEDRPFLLRQPTHCSKDSHYYENESVETNRNPVMDPNEISFNKDQFGNMFKKDSESERSLVSDRRRDVLDSNALYGIHHPEK